MIILGIETSCDETAVAVIKGSGGRIKILSNLVSSQIAIHRKYGGVVPEVAAREHVRQILPVINQALTSPPTPLLGQERGARNKTAIDAIAVTVGPGLITSLLAGVETAKSLAYAWDLPLLAVNHIEAHIYANFIDRQEKNIFPVLVLTVSGGHTMLVLMRGHGQYQTIGQTRDDAAGEAFDKAGQLLGLGYPGGPSVAKQAAELKIKKQKAKNINLPRPMINSKNFDFSFSGLKTALLYKLKADKNWKKTIPAYAAEFQQAVVEALVSKTIKAAKQYQASTVMLTGGVAANQELRRQLAQAVREQLGQRPFIMPDLKYTTDNAAMVAAAGYFKALRREFTPWRKVRVNANLEL